MAGLKPCDSKRRVPAGTGNWGGVTIGNWEGPEATNIFMSVPNRPRPHSLVALCPDGCFTAIESEALLDESGQTNYQFDFSNSRSGSTYTYRLDVTASRFRRYKIKFKCVDPDRTVAYFVPDGVSELEFASADHLPAVSANPFGSFTGKPRRKKRSKRSTVRRKT